MRPIRVLVADDSPFLCKLLAHYLKEAGGFDVVGQAHTGATAIRQAAALRPDVIALDLTMPDMDGVDALETIMRDSPAPVVVITGVSGTSAIQTLRALDAGATDFVLKFDPAMPTSPEALSREVTTKLRRAARRTRQADFSATSLNGIVVVGASTGGPGALREMLAEIAPPFPAAILVVQHVPAAFSAVLAADLARSAKLPVAEYRRGERLINGVIRVAPGGTHLLLEANGEARLTTEPAAEHCPSIDLTMESAAEVAGENATGVLLTGMGADGVRGLAAIRRRGGRTFAQDPETCVVAGMPSAAIAEGVVESVAAPAELGRQLRQRLWAGIKKGDGEAAGESLAHAI
jgi:two-component system, chemotaxis family, protein-glutamate methylesterase/glutaminase